MNIFSKFEELDLCPTTISAFRVVNTLSRLSEFYRTSGRENYALTYVTEGKFIYYFNDRSDEKEPHENSFECRAGELTFLPKGSTYHHRNPIPSSMYVLYFSLLPEISSDIAEPIHLKVSDPKHFEHLFEAAVNNYFKPKRSNLEVKSSLCTILSALADEEAPSKLSEHELSMLAPAINALSDAGMTKGYPTVSELARLCSLSEFTFRELFKRYAGITPKKFIDIRRVEQVESLLTTKDITITNAALACGFNDPSYFFKLYKRIRGRTLGETL